MEGSSWESGWRAACTAQYLYRATNRPRAPGFQGLSRPPEVQNGGVLHHPVHILFPGTEQTIGVILAGIVVVEGVIQRKNPGAIQGVENILVREDQLVGMFPGPGEISAGSSSRRWAARSITSTPELKYPASSSLCRRTRLTGAEICARPEWMAAANRFPQGGDPAAGKRG